MVGSLRPDSAGRRPLISEYKQIVQTVHVRGFKCFYSVSLYDKNNCEINTSNGLGRTIPVMIRQILRSRG